MIGGTLMMLAQIGAPSPEVTLPKAFPDALDFDRTAYNQICGNPVRKKAFEQLQSRAEALASRYWHDREPDTVVRYYVDRRARRCRHPERFESTASNWRAALDKIEIAMKEAR